MSKLVIYREGKKVEMKDKYPLADVYLNVKRRSFDDIEGMCFTEVVVCEGCTTLDGLSAKKFLIKGDKFE